MSTSNVGGVVESSNPLERNDHADVGRASAPSGERAVPYHCPFCAEEDLRPHGETHGAWHCRACLRVFSVKFLGIESVSPGVATRTPFAPDQTTNLPGGPR